MSEYEVGLYRIIGEMIREIRTMKGMTLDQVADKLDVIPKTLQRYETGERKIKISMIRELANILGFDYDAFMIEAKYRLIGENSIVREPSTYYVNDETKKIAQEIFDDKDMKLLFDLKNSTQADRLMDYARYLKEQYDKENGL